MNTCTRSRPAVRLSTKSPPKLYQSASYQKRDLPKDRNQHIRPLWISQSKDSDVQQMHCEVDTGAGFNVLPVCKVKVLFGQE